jgi:hypothetical protein
LLHGLSIIAPTKININKYSVKIKKVHYTTSWLFYFLGNKTSHGAEKKTPLNLLIKLPNSKQKFYIDNSFIEWFIGFVDAEGNFNISLRNYKDNNYNSLISTFQIGLHIDDLEVLKFIQKNLKCGKITISGNRCNFFLNDRASLINIIIPVFNFAKLKKKKTNIILHLQVD